MEITIDKAAMRKFSYGLFLLTARDGGRDNGCVINTAIQAASSPERVSIAVNKGNLTHDMILSSGEFCLSVLTQEAPFPLFEGFGMRSGRDADKFAGVSGAERSGSGLLYLPEYSNAMICGRLAASVDCGSHTLFLADVTESRVLSAAPSLTYDWYYANIKPRPQKKTKGWVCRVCGYVYEGENLPPDFICPLCKHGAEDFEPLS